VEIQNIVVHDILVVISSYFRLYDINATVAYKTKTRDFLVEHYVSFQMPTDDGGTYWEEEVGSRMSYDWANSDDALEWVISQTKR